MKALSRHKKRGRPRKEGERYPSGDIKRSETEKEAKSVVLEYRKAHYALDEDEAKSDLAGSALGLLYLKGCLGDLRFHKGHADALLEAGTRYSADVYRYFTIVLGRAPTPQAQNVLRVRGLGIETEDTAIERGKKATNKFMAAEGVLLRVSPQAKRSVYLACVDDEHNLINAPTEQMAWLRKGLRALAEHYGVM